MARPNIFLGSGASVTFVPEVDIYLKPDSLDADKSTLTIDTDFTNRFDLVNDLYVGCVLEFYDNGTLTTTHRITSNTGTKITFHPAQTITLDTTNDYYRLKGYGAPCPAKKVLGGSNVHTDEVTHFTFASDTKSDYFGDWIYFYEIQTDDAGTEKAVVVWWDTTGSDTVPSHGVTGSPTVVDVDISDSGLTTQEEYIAATVAAINAESVDLTASRSNNILIITNTYGGPTTDANSSNASHITHEVVTQGSTAISSSTAKKLNSDNWLGIVESLTFPSVDVEFKQQNLFVGGSRNYTYQYKGIETAGNASIGVVANHGAWLYYFFGKCSSISATLLSSTNPISDFQGAAAGEDKFYLNGSSVTETGPLFYRSIDRDMTPPVLRGQDTYTDLQQLDPPTIDADGHIEKAITYTFTEQEGDDLPSFALEQVFSKLPSSNTYRTSTDNDNEDTNFVLIATGNRVNTLTMTANENEELKMTMDCMPRKVHNLEKTESYEARRGVTNETEFINYYSEDACLEPFFFSSGSISMFGQDFMRITNFTLTMNNTLTDKRFIGIGSKTVKDAIPAQRTYELTFSALVTDDMLFNELKNQHETTGTVIDLIFDKGSEEQIRLKFDDYFLTTNTWPIPEDKGAVTVEATIIPRSLNSCTVKTHWILQG